MIKAFSFSIQQEACFNSSGNVIIEAVAGAGKTSTLVELIKRAKADNPALKICYLVFNKKNQTEAAEKITADLATVSTFHSIGFRAWVFSHKGLKVDTNVYNKRKAISQELNIPMFLETFVFQLLEKLQAAGLGAIAPLTTEALEELVDHYSLDMELADHCKGSYDEKGQPLSLYDLINQGIEITKEALQVSNRLANEGLMSFSDQLYMPIQAKCRMIQYDWVLIDEAQDVSPIRLALAAKILKPGGRLVAVGDRHQAIYGFTGADNESLKHIKERFNCQELPLTVSYRCPKAVVAFARQWVDHITAADDAPEGEVIRATFVKDLFIEQFSPAETDAILCRNTKPLVEIAYNFLAKGLACKIEGREIGAGLVKMATKWKIKSLDVLTQRLNDYRDKQIQALMAKGKETAADSLNDQIDCLLFLIETMPNGSDVFALKTKIEGMFSDDVSGCLTLSTIHKSKGREWNRVFWLGRNKFQPSKFARQAWQQEQEINLMYVAATRSKNILIDLAY